MRVLYLLGAFLTALVLCSIIEADENKKSLTANIQFRECKIISDFEPKSAYTQTLNYQNDRPLSMASGDLDEDGVPDIVIGYSANDGGGLSLHLGNIDSIWPNTSESRARKANGTFIDQPFLQTAQRFHIPESANFIGVGDFDADRHADVVAASRNGKILYFLAGDGRGDLAPPRSIVIPGRITAVAIGEINQRDGLDDIAVAAIFSEGPRLLIFQSSSGAITSEPQIIGVPGEVNSLAFGQLDENSGRDIVATSGGKLVLIHGCSSLECNGGASKIDAENLNISALSVTVGVFVSEAKHNQQLAFSTKTGEVGILQRIETDHKWNQVRTIQTENVDPAILIRARTALSGLDTAIFPNKDNNGISFVVGDGQIISRDLHQDNPPLAILPMRLNKDALNDFILLYDDPLNPISVLLSLPLAFYTVNVLGDSEPGPSGCPCQDDPTYSCCLSGSTCTLRTALELVNGCGGPAEIDFDMSDYPNPPFTIHLNGDSGPDLPLIMQSAAIDGTTVGGYAGSPLIEIQDVAGYFFYTFASDTVVRGIAMNSSPQAFGVVVQPNAVNTILEGNYIGTDITGSVASPNFIGLAMLSNLVTIGGDTVFSANIISGNLSDGIQDSGSTGATIIGNKIGTNVTGTAAVTNGGSGIRSVGGYFDQPTIGGSNLRANVISGNGSDGLTVACRDCVIQGNYIGTDDTGTFAIPNNGNGIMINENGSLSLKNNIISGNALNGIVATKVNSNLGEINDNLVSGNTKDGMQVVGDIFQIFNNKVGLHVDNSQWGNGGNGILLGLNDAISYLTQSSAIATNTIAYNASAGVEAWTSTNNNLISANTIFNNGTGVLIEGTQDLITKNKIFSNNSLGISLQDGANNDIPFPTITSAANCSGPTTIQGEVMNPFDAETIFTLEFFSNSICDQSGFGEGENYAGSTQIAVGNLGTEQFTLDLGVTIPDGQFITVTSSGDSNTSEFSECHQVVVSTGTAPVITMNPVGTTLFTGETVTLFVEATGTDPLTYQWFEGNTGDTSHPIAFATSNTYTTPPMYKTTLFWVRVGNICGTANSTAAKVTVECRVEDTTDTDGDQISDCWENNGRTLGPDHLDLPAMGADPKIPDVFVELDYMLIPGGHSHQFKIDDVIKVVNAYKLHGINLHVDCGKFCPMTVDSVGNVKLWNELSEARPIEEKLFIGEDWVAFKEFRNNEMNFSKLRSGIFHYAISAHHLKENDCTSGQSHNDATTLDTFFTGSDEFIISLGGWPFMTPNGCINNPKGTGTTFQRTGTLMHELGHNMGLAHGGRDHDSWKPNFLSVMNYSFQNNGLLRSLGTPGSFDYSNDLYLDLDEISLDETKGISLVPTLFGTIYYCSGQSLGVFDSTTTSIDWDCDSPPNDTEIVTANINKSTSPTYSILKGYTDWNNLNYSGGGNIHIFSGESNPKSLQSTPDDAFIFEELTPDMAITVPIIQGVVITPSEGSLVVSGQSYVSNFSIENTGMSSDTYDLTAQSSQGWTDLTSLPTSITLSPGEIQQFLFTTNVPSAVPEGAEENLTLKAQSQSNPDLVDGATNLITPGYFYDDFEDGDLTNPTWIAKKAIWSVIDGEAYVSTASKTDLYSPSYVSCSTCTYETKMKISSGGRSSLFAWYLSGNNSVEVRLMQDKQKLLLKQKAGSSSKKAKVLFPILPDSLYQISINFDGSAFHVFVDGVEKLSMSALSAPSGNLKFRVKSGTRTNVTATFESIFVH